MIQRKGVGDYQRVTRKALTERKPDDFDLRFAETSVYVLGETEYFEPYRSKKSAGVSSSAMFGPAVVVQANSFDGTDTSEFHVNDPRLWNWVQNCMKNGAFNADNCEVLLPRGSINIKAGKAAQAD